MNCPACGRGNREGAKFCDECGGELELVCGQCRQVNRTGANFCDGCGARLTEPPTQPALDFKLPRSYTPKYLANKILTTRSAIEGERKLVTVMFADVAGFTAMSEKLDPGEVHRIMDGCCRILVDEIHRVEVTVGEFRGDGVTALFGAPIAHKDHVQRACHAALAPCSEEIKRNFVIEFRICCGFNLGTMSAEAIGDDLRMAYTAVGDTTILAGRMETTTEPGGVLVSPSTHLISFH